MPLITYDCEEGELHLPQSMLFTTKSGVARYIRHLLGESYCVEEGRHFLKDDVVLVGREFDVGRELLGAFTSIGFAYNVFFPNTYCNVFEQKVSDLLALDDVAEVAPFAWKQKRGRQLFDECENESGLIAITRRRSTRNGFDISGACAYIHPSSNFTQEITRRWKMSVKKRLE